MSDNETAVLMVMFSAGAIVACRFMQFIEDMASIGETTRGEPKESVELEEWP